MAKYTKEAQHELTILETFNIIPKQGIFEKDDIIQKIAEAKEAADDLEVDDLDDVTEELDKHADKLDKHAKMKPVKKAGAEEEEEDDLVGDDFGTDDDKSNGVAKIKAADLNKSKYSLKLLFRLYESLLNKVGTNVALPISTISDSKGDIKKLGTLYKDFSYSEVFDTMIHTHRVVCEGLSGGKESKYFEIFEKFLKNVNKNTPKFKKAYTKHQENIVKSIYVASVMYLFEMSTVLSACTVHMFNKNSEKDGNFDKILEETKDYVNLFNSADNMYNDPETDVNKLLSSELSISESYNHLFLQSIDDTSELDPELAAMTEGLNLTESINMSASGIRNKTVGLAHIAKLFKYGLSITIYKMFAAIRYIIYVVNYQKFSITNKINLIKTSLELVSADGNANNRNATRNDVTQASMNYRADMIQSANKATVDAATNDKEEFNF